MRKIVLFLTTTLSVFGLSLVVGYRAHSQQVLQTEAMKPFIAHKRVLHTPGAQRTPTIQQEIYARRSDGSSVRKYEVASPAGETGWAVIIHDRRKNRNVKLEPFTKSATTFYYSHEEMPDKRPFEETCASPDLAAAANSSAEKVKEKMHGREAVRAVTEDSYRQRTERTERWVAPDLDCYPLQKTITRHNGAHPETTVTELEEMEPPDSMFEIPPDYVEASPMHVEAAYAAKYPGYLLFGEQTLKLVNDRYFKNRNKR